MKRGIRGLVAALVLTFITAEGGQAANWHGIVRAGGASGRTSGDNRLGSDFRTGFTGSLSAELQLNEDFGIEWGIGYIQKGAKGTITSTGTSSQPQIILDGTAELDYVDLQFVPTIHQHLGDQSEVRFYIGTSLGILANAKAEGTLNGASFETDIKDGLKSVDWAGIVGIGFAVDVKNVQLLFDLRGQIGFISIDDTPSDESLRTYTGTYTIGILLPITGR